MSFALTGALDAHDDDGGVILNSEARVEVEIYAQDIYYDAPFAGSFSPFGYGAAATTTTLFEGTTTTVPFTFPNTSPDFQLSHDGSGGYELFLSPAFFSNPSNTHLLLRLRLGVDARASNFWREPGVSVVDAASDFGNTFTMTSLQAFDVDDIDVTADAIAGFASDALPLPEPDSYAAWAAGLSWVVAVSRRRRAPSTDAT